MTQLGEAIKVATVGQLSSKCPFCVPEPPEDTSDEDEDWPKDDSLGMAKAQANSGSKLGSNLESASPGTSGTWNVLGGNPPLYEETQVDTARDPAEPMVRVDGDDYPFTVAAHHLIPGNAALYESLLFKHFMKRGGKAKTVGGRSVEMSRNIGYNVNGSHNGIWLPGSYAIRSGVHPSGKTWSVLNASPSTIQWCRDYIAAVTKKTGVQFHDTHVKYNTNVRAVLNKLHDKIMNHLDTDCPDCANSDKVTPPYVAKARLYRLSSFLRGKLRRKPRSWSAQDAWMASDQVHSDIMGQRAAKARFLKVYRKAAG